MKNPSKVVAICFGLTIISATSAAPAPSPSVTSTLPDDVEIPKGFKGNPIEFFDDFSWRSFVALNWPAKHPESGTIDRGVADSTVRLSASASSPTVWETWKSDWEMIPDAKCLEQPSGCSITPWNEFGENPCGTISGPDTRILASFSSFENLAQAGFGNLDGPIVDQGNHYVRFEIRANRQAFDQIFQRKLYVRDNLPTSSNPVVFADGTGGGPHAVVVKAAWRDVTDLPAESRARFLIRSVLVFDPVELKCGTREMGLVGLHIVQKTVSRPQWIWSTFEQIDNVPEKSPPIAGETPAQAPFSFNDGLGTPISKKTRALSPTNPPVAHPDKTQIARGRDIDPSTRSTNSSYQNADGVKESVFRFYKLVMTQWPVTVRNPDGTLADGMPAHTFPGTGDTTAVSNSAIETFRQNSVSNGCMACHNLATTDAFTDFIWFPTTRAVPPPGSPLPAPTIAGGTLGLAPPIVVQEPRLDGLKKVIESQ